MPSRSELPGEIKVSRFINALVRCGFAINTIGGKGSHCKVIWPSNQKSITIIRELRKDVLYYILKEIEQISGVTWDEIKEKL